MSYLDQRRAFIQAGRPLPEKKKHIINKVSSKRAAKIKEQKESGASETEKQKFFNRMRKRMTGTCQCGCGTATQKNDDTFFRNCICHIFPQRIFPSIEFHELNWVERNFWNGDHSNMDNRSIELWKNFADFEDIKEKFFILSPLLTDAERGTKFYSNLEKIIYEKS